MNLQEQAQQAYDLVKSTIDKILEQGLQNNQEWLDWVDSINKQSVRF